MGKWLNNSLGRLQVLGALWIITYSVSFGHLKMTDSHGGDESGWNARRHLLLSLSLSSQWSPIWSLVYLMVNSRTKEEKKTKEGLVRLHFSTSFSNDGCLYTHFMSVAALWFVERAHFSMIRECVCVQNVCVLFYLLLYLYHTTPQHMQYIQSSNVYLKTIRRETSPKRNE